MKKLLLTVALMGVAVMSWTSSASAHPGCYHPYHHSGCWYPNYSYQYDDDYYCHPPRRHLHVIFVP
jgi:hypothetical protein